jgi:hypothetical protein
MSDQTQGSILQDIVDALYWALSTGGQDVEVGATDGVPLGDEDVAGGGSESGSNEG